MLIFATDTDDQTALRPNQERTSVPRTSSQIIESSRAQHQPQTSDGSTSHVLRDSRQAGLRSSITQVSLPKFPVLRSSA